MILAAGSKLGPYEIVAPLGAGGMGEVWRARDTRLGRDVAIKVLPPALAATPEVRARFEREAKTISSLNHPNICTLHDVGHEGDTDFLVMELVEGETLAMRLAHGPLPAAELLRIGVQVADALDRAHRSGVIHRDLKPGNIMLTRNGAKLLDFGLARGGPAAGGSGLASGVSSLSNSPTMAQPLTAEGTIVGTFQYMAPEQLEGREADARSDLWAFGAVLYEMATGRHAFEGRSQASLIAAILEKEPPPIGEVAPLSPPGLDRLVRACLAKDPDQRLQTAHDAKLQLQWVAEGGSQAGVPAPVAARRRGREALAWTVAVTAVAATLALGALLVLRRPVAPEVTRFTVGAPAGTSAISWPRVSPDGRMLVFLAADSTGVAHVWVRPLDALEAHPLAEVEGNARPFWSPDSRSLAFISEGKLRKVPVSGGPAVAVCDAPGGSDGSWGRGDVILFDGGPTDTVRAVPASGGVPRGATTLDRSLGETQTGWPFFLPDGRHFLFVSYSPREQLGAIRFGTLGSLRSKVVGHTDGRVEYAPPGYLVYPNAGTLLAQPFDSRAGRTTGDPVPVGEDVAMGDASGDFSISTRGVMAYRSEKSVQQSRLVWMGRDGRVLSDAAPPGNYNDIALSPDGHSIAFGVLSGQPSHSDIWVRDLVRGVSSRLTFDPADEVWPVWSPDGTRIAYAVNNGGTFHMMVKAANGVGTADSLAHVPGDQGPTDWSRDGRTILSAVFGAKGWDVYSQPADPAGKPVVVVQTPFNEREGTLSPDGRWLAYTSSESGRPEVYVVPFPGPGGKWQVSTAGGNYPYWRGDGRELFFRAADQTVMTVPVTAGATFVPGTPQALFKMTVRLSQYGSRRWTVSADGQRFLANVARGDASTARFVVVTDWTAELRRR